MGHFEEFEGKIIYRHVLKYLVVPTLLYKKQPNFAVKIQPIFAVRKQPNFAHLKETFYYKQIIVITTFKNGYVPFLQLNPSCNVQFFPDITRKIRRF